MVTITITENNLTVVLKVNGSRETRDWWEVIRF